MKYIIMAGGSYEKFEMPKQLLKVNGEVIIERTIRLLRENGVKDIAISTNNPAFDYLDVEKLVHINEYSYIGANRNKRSYNNWLNAYYPMKEPACYLHGDVFFSENAIKTIVETPVKDTMFFCVRDLQDGRPMGINPKGREPLAYKVQNQKLFRKAINDLFQYIDEGKYAEGLEPISWHLYRRLNNLDLCFNVKGYNANDIFKTKGDYIYIDDYTTDVDFLKDIPEIEKFIKLARGGENMIKAKVIEDFYLEKFNELKNITRATSKKEEGHLYVNDTFECTEEMAEYLLGKNKIKRAFIKIIEVIPEEKTVKTEKKTTTRRRKKSIAKD